jgi:hypothetical protein
MSRRSPPSARRTRARPRGHRRTRPDSAASR